MLSAVVSDVTLLGLKLSGAMIMSLEVLILKRSTKNLVESED
jgi:hypothetical protein